MHTESLPKSDRVETPDVGQTGSVRPHDPQLIAALKSTGVASAAIARGIGKSAGTISQYMNGKYPGDVSALEHSFREWLRDRNITITSGVATVECEISNRMCKHFEEIRTECELAVIEGPAGIGKSRGTGLYVCDHSLAIPFRTLTWHSGMNSLAADIASAADITRFPHGKKKWDVICEKTAGSGRLLIIDDAHELSHGGLQSVVDYHDKTGNPVALVALLKKLREKLLRDDRRARRVDHVYTLECKDPLPLIKHLVDQLAPEANGEKSDLINICLQVVSKSGAFGSVEMQLKAAARNRRKKPDLSWVEAFRAAHLRLLRSYKLN